MIRLLQQQPAGGAPSWVVDVALSLAPTGLYCVRELSRLVPVWLAQSHWSIVNDETFYSRDESLVRRLTRTSDPDAAGRSFAQIVRDWRDARDALGLESAPGLFWPGDGKSDSVVPKDGDATLVDRLDALAAGLDSLRRRDVADPARQTVDLLADCARDTVALAAALGGSRPIVLTPLEPQDRRPILVDNLQTAGIACAKVANGRLLAPLRGLLAPTLIGSGLAALVSTNRLRLAALMIVAPHALPAPIVGDAPEEPQDRLAWNAMASGVEARLWDGAAAIWWDVP